MNACAIFYIDLPLLVLAKMNHYFRMNRTAAKGCVDIRSSGTRCEYPEICAALPARIAHSELVLTHWVWLEPNRPYATDGGVAQELWRYQVRVE